MKPKAKHIIIIVIVFTVAFLAIYYAAKNTIPLSYAVTDIREDAVQYVLSLQAAQPLSARECAERYLYFNTDYHSATPERIIASEAIMANGLVRITLHNPSCADDSVYASIDRIYLFRDEKGYWRPIKHEWSHKGRGRFGWTTQPTI